MRRCRQLTGEANALERELAVLVADYAPQLLELKGCGVLIAAKLIGENAGVERFRHEAQLARLAGVAPVDCSSGQQRRHRLNRHGNRELNSALHKIAVVQGRWDTESARLPRAPPSRRQDPPRGTALPQAPPRPRRQSPRPSLGLRRVWCWCSCPPTAPAGCDERRLSARTSRDRCYNPSAQRVWRRCRARSSSAACCSARALARSLPASAGSPSWSCRFAS